jgi:signal transduction histidine kinase
LRRTLAIRFAATMAVGLAAAGAATVWAISRGVDTGRPEGLLEVALALGAVVLLGAGATLVGAWRLAGSAVRPVSEITAQATRIEGGTLDQRIVAHADTPEYRELVEVLNRMLDRIERAFGAQRRLVSDVGHELKTPLTALRGEIEVALRSERTPHEYARVLESSLEEIEGLQRMTDDLLFITRAESRLVEPQRAPVNVDQLVQDLVRRWQPRFDSAGLSPVLDLRAASRVVPLDARLVVRLLERLVGNAIKHSPPQGTVELGTAPGPDGGVRLSVGNAGPVIDPAHLARFFEPFYRVDPARPRTGGGAGLGLTLVATIARMHGGAARVTSDATRGTRFEVDLAATN